MSEFSFTELKNHYEHGKLRDYLDCKQYILSHFCPTTDGQHVFYEINDSKPEIVQEQTFNTVYLARFPKELQKWYKTETIPRKLISDIHKPGSGPNFVNLAGRKKHEYVPYDTFSTKTKQNVKFMHDFIKDIWANNNQIVYDYLIKWLANMIQGNKNQACIYVKGEEGIGKSTVPNFIVDHVLGRDLWTLGKAEHLKGQYNSQLLGKLFVVFEELQTFSDREWQAVDTEIKAMIRNDLMLKIIITTSF
jgi:hypothetical protein